MAIPSLNLGHVILIISALVARLIAFYFYGDNQLENEWKILVNNLYIYDNQLYVQAMSKIRGLRFRFVLVLGGAPHDVKPAARAADIIKLRSEVHGIMYSLKA